MVNRVRCRSATRQLILMFFTLKAGFDEAAEETERCPYLPKTSEMKAELSKPIIDPWGDAYEHQNPASESTHQSP